LLNFSPDPIEDMPFVFPRAAKWKLLVNTDDPQYGANFTGLAGKTSGFDNQNMPVTMAPFSAQIFGVDK
jgi:hypothetical protein